MTRHEHAGGRLLHRFEDRLIIEPLTLAAPPMAPAASSVEASPAATA